MRNTKTAPHGAGSGLFGLGRHTALEDHLRKYGASPRKVAKRLGIPKREVRNWWRGIGVGFPHTEWRYTMFDVERLMKVMSEILSDKYDIKITMTAVPKDKEDAAA